MEEKLKKGFSKTLLKWHSQIDYRDMPWVGIVDPYFIWLSEIILQQTRVDQGRSYYKKFINTYPKIQDLANASEDEVLRLWQGLGYYSRARNLHETAKFIVHELNGKFPNQYNQLLNLKGVGAYTAAAIASFAYGEPIAVVDGNVIRVLSRIFGIDTAFDSNEGKKYFQELAQSLIDSKSIQQYNQAIMDFGAMICKPSSPLCTDCPFEKFCTAKEQNLISVLPVKSKKTIKKNRYFIFMLNKNKTSILIQKRKEKDIWKGLYQFPLFEIDRAQFDQFMKNDRPKIEGKGVKILGDIYTQVLTHQKIHAFFVSPSKPILMKDESIWVSFADVKNYAFPKIIDTFIQENKLFKTE